MQSVLQTSTVGRAVRALQQGQPILVYDADGREEETDIVVASEQVRPDHIRLLRQDGGGLICTTLHPRVHTALDLPYLSDVLHAASARHPLLARLANGVVPYEPGATRPSFGLTINHRATFTGVTDHDRALTVRALAALATQCGRLKETDLQDRFAKEFKAPGHVFLLNAHPDLLAARRGHTELATVLMELADLAPSATICEMMNGPSGKALPKQDAIKYAAQNGLVFLEGREVFDAWTTARRT
jgi:3,4-dihydroxy 2-butanone 4-phosphate synthase